MVIYITMRPVYEVQLEVFEGPLDLLLFFIRRQELDIRDIPLERITGQFLDHLIETGQIDLELVGEFLYAAAALLELKVRTLLPGSDVAGEPSSEQELPREEKAEGPLAALEPFRLAVQALQERRTRAGFRRGRIAELEAEEAPPPTLSLTLYQLLGAYGRVLVRLRPQPTLLIEPWPTTVERQSRWLLDRLQREGTLSFQQLMRELPDRMWVVITFLALLDLVYEGRLRLRIESDPERFAIELPQSERTAYVHAGTGP
jgi:segregation and condensation protein A|nr:MAG: segregation and condensation protein A [Bacteroidota bacterium]